MTNGKWHIKCRDPIQAKVRLEWATQHSLRTKPCEIEAKALLPPHKFGGPPPLNRYQKVVLTLKRKVFLGSRKCNRES